MTKQDLRELVGSIVSAVNNGFDVDEEGNYLITALEREGFKFEKE